MASDLILTRVVFDGADRRARHILASRERLHALVEAALDAGGSDKAVRRLWRLDRTPRGMVLYILADRAPSSDMLRAQLRECAVTSKPYGPFLDSLAAGGTLRLEMMVCATHSVNSRRVPLPADERGEWVRRQLAAAGCEPVSVRITGSDDLRFGRRGRMVSLRAFRVEAVVRVADPDAVRVLLTRGLGRAKGYGLGMVCPIRAATHDVGCDA